jgi:hypothetical protein
MEITKSLLSNQFHGNKDINRDLYLGLDFDYVIRIYILIFAILHWKKYDPFKKNLHIHISQNNQLTNLESVK